MAADVVALREVKPFEDRPEDLADYLERLAARVREGETAVMRGILIYQKPDATIGWRLFGMPQNTAESIGLIEYMKLDLFSYQQGLIP